MSWQARVLVGVAAAAVLSGGTAAAATAASPWGTAREVPGTGELNKAKNAAVTALSCARPGDCAAGGYYAPHGRRQAFVASETGGTWHQAIEVPGTAALDQGNQARVTSVSCPAAGTCVAGGWYVDSTRHTQAFVAAETGGTWHQAIELPGTAALEGGRPWAEVTTLSCPAPGDCLAGGFYRGHSGGLESLVATESGGTWQAATELAGTGTLNKDGDGQVSSVSCAAPGDCLAGGDYASASVTQPDAAVPQVYVATETGGRWQAAQQVPGTATSTSAGKTELNSVSCATPGNCAAVGAFANDTGFLASQVKGTWRTAVHVPGRSPAGAGTVSCAAPGDCTAGGLYLAPDGVEWALVVSSTDGTWKKAQLLPGQSALNSTPTARASVYSLSCPTLASCAAGGSYIDRAGNFQALVATETGGKWGAVQELPGSAALNQGQNALVNVVSCAAAGHCAAGGYYAGKGSLLDLQAMVTAGS